MSVAVTDIPESVREAIALHAEQLNTVEEARRFYVDLMELARERVEALAALDRAAEEAS